MKHYTVSENLLRELGDMRRQVDLLIAQQETIPGTTPIFRRYVAKASGTISAGTMPTPGSGTVTLYEYNSTSGDFEIMTDGTGANRTETVYNWTDTASGTDAWVLVEQDSLGTWILSNEAC